MILMRFIRKVPASIHGVGSFLPGKEYPLDDKVAQGLIDTNDPDWKRVTVAGNSGGSAAGKQDKTDRSTGASSTGAQQNDKGRK